MLTPEARGAIAVLRAALDPPADRVHDEPTGFAWRPHAFEQRIVARAFPGEAAVAVEASVRLLREVPGRAGDLAAIAAWNAREPGLSSLRWHSGTHEVSLRASVIVRPGGDDTPARRLAHAALLQLGEALLAADALALAIPGAVLAESAGADRQPVAQSEAARAYALGGADAAAGLVRDVAQLASLASAPWRRVTAAAHGIDAEIDCAAPGAAGPGADVALLRVSASQPHPRLGPGALVALVPPARLEPEAARAAATAALLQEGEAHEWTGVDALGGWCVHPATGLSHVGFVPALAVEAGTVAELATQAVMRARWAVRFTAHVRAMRERAAGPAPGR